MLHGATKQKTTLFILILLSIAAIVTLWLTQSRPRDNFTHSNFLPTTLGKLQWHSSPKIVSPIAFKDSNNLFSSFFDRNSYLKKYLLSILALLFLVFFYTSFSKKITGNRRMSVLSFVARFKLQYWVCAFSWLLALGSQRKTSNCFICIQASTQFDS